MSPLLNPLALNDAHVPGAILQATCAKAVPLPQPALPDDAWVTAEALEDSADVSPTVSYDATV
jgi:hypothetical protein